jgi:hypothetical protein
MSKRWGTRKYNQRRFLQAAGCVDVAIDHLKTIMDTLQDSHPQHKDMLQGLCAAGDEYRELILDARKHF